MVASSHDDEVNLRDSLERAWAGFNQVMVESGIIPAPLTDYPPLSDIKSFKSYLAEGLSALPNGASHKRVTLESSKFLFRKLLPSPPGDPVPDYLNKLATRPLVKDRYVRLLPDFVKSLFQEGFDRRYVDYCERVVFARSSCFEKARSKGGARGEGLRHFSQGEFIDLLVNGDIGDLSPTRRVMVLEDGGKKRIVTVATYLQHALLPLHMLLYDHISRKSWLLRGDAKLSAMDGLKRSRDAVEEVFVSGDYEAATDNFNSSHSELLLREISKYSTHVPRSIWEVAFKSLTGLLSHDGVLYAQRNGQMMGNFLSFPLLCITNYFGVYMALGSKRARQLAREGRLKINGDDIVFRCTIAEFQRWKSAVEDCGLVLSLGKTLVNKRLFSLNSTFFLAGFTSVTLVQTLRSATVWSPCDNINGVLGRLKAAVWGITNPRMKLSIRVAVLRMHLALTVYGVKRRDRAGLPDRPAWCSISRGSEGKVGARVFAKVGRHMRERENTILRGLQSIDRAPLPKISPRGISFTPVHAGKLLDGLSPRDFAEMHQWAVEELSWSKEEVKAELKESREKKLVPLFCYTRRSPAKRSAVALWPELVTDKCHVCFRSWNAHTGWCVYANQLDMPRRVRRAVMRDGNAFHVNMKPVFTGGPSVWGRGNRDNWLENVAVDQVRKGLGRVSEESVMVLSSMVPVLTRDPSFVSGSLVGRFVNVSNQ